MTTNTANKALKDWTAEFNSWNWDASPADIAKHLIYLGMHPHDESDDWDNFEKQFLAFFTFNGAEDALSTIADIVETFS